MTSETLRSCPFCGGEAHTYKNNLWHVGCERAHNNCVTISAFVTEAEAVAAWNARATGGTLTAEQVREAWCGNLRRDCLYDPPTPDWQAIADELNARAERTCELIDNGTWGYPYGCSECGASFDADVNDGDFNYCPNCGSRVVG